MKKLFVVMMIIVSMFVVNKELNIDKCLRIETEENMYTIIDGHDYSVHEEIQVVEKEIWEDENGNSWGGNTLIRYK